MLDRREFLAAALAPVRMRRERGWPALRVGSHEVTTAGEGFSVQVSIAGERYPRPSDPMTRVAGAVLYRCGPATIRDETAAAHGFAGCLRRVLRVRNISGRTVDLTGAVFRLCVRVPEDAARWAAQSFAMAETTARGPTVCAAFTSSEDRWDASVERGAKGLVVTHTSNAAWRLAPGAEAVIGAQYFWAVNSGLHEARQSAAAWYQAIGLHVPDDLPDWIRDSVLFEASAGGTLDSRFGDTGGFDAFGAQVDYLADAGFNALWLLNPLTHKDPRQPREGWNHYDPLRYDEVDPAYGGEAALERLVRRLRERGFKLLCEMVPHGGRSDVAKNSVWWTYNQDGSRRIGYGQSPDYSAPGWQAEIRKAVQFLTRRFGFDGWRVDVADGYGINWSASHNLPHVSRSTMAGAIGMLQAIRAGAKEAGVNPVLLPETHLARPEFAPVSGLGYGFDLKFLVEREMLWTAPPAERARKLREFFRNQQDSDPYGTVHLRGPDNHDTAGGLFGRGEYRFGIGLYRALLGVCGIVDGFPMVYQGEERGNYEHLRRIFHTRQQTPELRRGRCDYDAVAGPAEVFAVLRSHGKLHAVGVVNLSGRTVDGAFVLPGKLVPDGTVVHDAVSGRAAQVTADSIKWRLAPYATAVLRLGSGAAPGPPPERHQPRMDSSGLELSWIADRAVVSVERLADGATKVRVEGEPDARVRLQVDGVDRWYVQSIAGLYSDRLIRRHYPWPEGRYKWEPSSIGGPARQIYLREFQPDRLWQSALAPLIGGGVIALVGPQGGGIKVSGVETNAMNFVLADSSMALSGTAAESEDRYRCRLELLAHDKHLNPRFAPPYLGRIWNVVSPRDVHQPLKAEFVITPADQIRFEDLDGYELEDFARASREIGPGKWSWLWHRILILNEPNSVTWRRLPLEHAGEYTLFLALRHSAKAPEATEMTGLYTITFDGKARQWTWERLNALPRRLANAYIGWARVPLGHLAAGEHELQVRASGAWTVIGEDMYVSRDPAFRP